MLTLSSLYVTYFLLLIGDSQLIIIYYDAGYLALRDINITSLKDFSSGFGRPAV